MPTFLMISRHSPESCPLFNEKTRKVTLDTADKLEGLAKKHGVKLVGGWSEPSEHLMIHVHEAPSLEAFQKFGMEPEIAAWAAYNTSEMKVVMTFEETVKMLKQAK